MFFEIFSEGFIMKMRAGGFLLGITLGISIIPSVTVAKEVYINGIPHYPQQNITWCGAAVAQMWIQYLNGWSPTQKEIASGYLFGIDSYDMEEILEKWTGRSFDVNGHSDEGSARKRIYQELREQGRPLAIAGTTVYAGGSKTRVGGHWRLIWAANIDGSSNQYKISWVKVMDPLYGSAWQSQYQVFAPGSQMSYDDLFKKHWKAFPNGSRQTVDD